MMQTTNQGVGTLRASDVAPESEVDSQISQLFDAIGQLENRLGTLGVRLTPVLSPYASGTEGDGKAEARRSLSPVAERVRGAFDAVTSLTARAEAMLGSLAV